MQNSNSVIELAILNHYDFKARELCFQLANSLFDKSLFGFYACMDDFAQDELKYCQRGGHAGSFFLEAVFEHLKSKDGKQYSRLKKVYLDLDARWNIYLTILESNIFALDTTVSAYYLALKNNLSHFTLDQLEQVLIQFESDLRILGV
jgi:hypothetical protein